MNRHRFFSRYSRFACILSGACLLAFCAVSQASIIQGIGDNFVAFEAENFDSLSGTTFVSTDTTPTLTTAYGSPVLPGTTNASAGGALFANFSGSSSSAGYDITFTSTGNYYIYVRYSLFENNTTTTSYGNEDSFYLSSDFDTPVGNTDIETIDVSSLGFTPSSGEWEGNNFYWRQVSGRIPSSSSRIDRVFNVTSGDLGTPMALNISPRERGLALDMFVLSTEDNLTETQLNQFVAVPEPSCALLLSTSLGGLAFLRRRRRYL